MPRDKVDYYSWTTRFWYRALPLNQSKFHGDEFRTEVSPDNSQWVSPDNSQWALRVLRGHLTVGPVLFLSTRKAAVALAEKACEDLSFHGLDLMELHVSRWAEDQGFERCGNPAYMELEGFAALCWGVA